MKEVVFLSGLPRTGSTVLASMLNQHPDVHATTTSPVADLVTMAAESWPRISGAIKNRDSRQYGGILDGLIQGSYGHLKERWIIEKNRLWPRLAPVLYSATGVKPKIICTVRSVPEIMSSYFILMNHNPGNNFVDSAVTEAGLEINTKNRCQVLLEKFIGHPYTSLRIGHNSGAADILYVEYADIVGNPEDTLSRIWGFIGCNPFNPDTDNLESMEENDHFHGGMEGLHDIRPVLGRVSPPPEKIIGLELTSYYTGMKLEFWRNSKPRSEPISSAPVQINTPKNIVAQTPEPLEGDSLDYDLLYRAAVQAANTTGLYCEIGVRRGGSLKYIMDAVATTGTTSAVIAIDPYGNIDYNATENYRGKLDYTNVMKNESMPNIYAYAAARGINLIFINLEDTEFFVRYSDGVPVYNEFKEVVNNYAFVFFDGPHDVSSLMVEIDFFIERVQTGSVFVFDDIASYNHGMIHQYLLERGWRILEQGSQRRKISYVLR